jgi:hypothetical protein
MTGKILIITGFFMAAAGIMWGYSNYSFISSAGKTEAHVKKIIPGHRRITPVFEYTVNGITYEFEDAATNSGAYQIGDKEFLYYNPKLPGEHKKDTFMSLWFLPVFLTGFGIIVLPAGIILTFFSQKKNPAFFIKKTG